MKDNYLLDTNILVYSLDSTAGEKQKISQNLVTQALQDGCGLISSQVVQEFLNLATRKFAVPMKAEAHDYLNTILLPLCRIYSGPELYHEALRLHLSTKYSFYDALIIAAAIEGDCRILYSEDLQHGHKIGRLKIVNPFKE